MITEEELMFQKLSSVEEYDFGIIDPDNMDQFLDLCLRSGLIKEVIEKGIYFYVTTHQMRYRFTEHDAGVIVCPPCALFVQSPGQDIEYVEGVFPAGEHASIIHEHFIVD